MGESNRELLAIYDLRLCPPTFDFLNFLDLAVGTAHREGCDRMTIVVYDPIAGEKREAMQWGMEWRIQQILLPAMSLSPLLGERLWVRSEDTLRHLLGVCDTVFPRDYAVDHPVAAYSNGAVVRSVDNGSVVSRNLVPPTEAVQAVTDWISSRTRQPPVSITLRTCTYQVERNSSLDDWILLAEYVRERGYAVVWVPDLGTPAELLEQMEGMVCEPATTNLLLRAGLYHICALNMFVSNGPSGAAWTNRSADYLYFKPVVDAASSASIDHFLSQSFWPERQWPGAGASQRIFWEDDTFGMLKLAFECWLERSRGDAILWESNLEEQLSRSADQSRRRLLTAAGHAFEPKSEFWRSQRYQALLDSGENLMAFLMDGSPALHGVTPSEWQWRWVKRLLSSESFASGVRDYLNHLESDPVWFPHPSKWPEHEAWVRWLKELDHNAFNALLSEMTLLAPEFPYILKRIQGRITLVRYFHALSNLPDFDEQSWRSKAGLPPVRKVPSLGADARIVVHGMGEGGRRVIARLSDLDRKRTIVTSSDAMRDGEFENCPTEPISALVDGSLPVAAWIVASETFGSEILNELVATGCSFALLYTIETYEKASTVDATARRNGS